MSSNQSPAAPSPAVANKSRSRKPAPKGPLIVKLKAPADFLRSLNPPPIIKDEAVTKPSSSSSLNTIASASVSSPPTEIKAETTPVPVVLNGATAMLPPTEAVKKRAAPRGTKRNSSAMGDSTPKPRGKPGPKKKPRLEDGSIDHTSTPPATTTTGRAPAGHSHKLGPKANQGAINAGLRALDRSGKPCRKWQKGSFRLRTFTGRVWELSRWTAPPKMICLPEMSSSAATTSGSGDASGKENKGMASSALESNKSVSDFDSLVSSPTPPTPIATA